MRLFQTVRAKFYGFAVLLCLLFSLSYAELSLFHRNEWMLSERLKDFSTLERSFSDLARTFLELRLREKDILFQEQADAEKSFASLLQQMNAALEHLKTRLQTDPNREGITRMHQLFAQYEQDFNRIVQVKTEQRLNLTSLETNYQALVSTVLATNATDLLKPLFSLNHFQQGYLGFHRDSEYWALQLILSTIERKLSGGHLLDDRLQGYIDTYRQLLEKDFSLRKQNSALLERFDSISLNLTELCSDIADKSAHLLKTHIEETEDTRRRQHRWFFSAILAATGIFALLLIVMARKIVHPVRSIAEIAQQVKLGNLKARYRTKGESEDEIAQMGQAFNEMLDAQEQINSQLLEYQRELETKVAQLAESQGELREHREQLERVVEARTRELQTAIETLQGEIRHRESVENELKTYRDHLEHLVQQRTAELVKAHEQLRHAQKMEAVGTLAGGVAHDFNNLLQAVQGFAELLIVQRKPGDAGYRELQSIKRAALRGADLTRQLLAFSRKMESRLRRVNINEEVERISKLFERVIPRMIGIELQLNENLKPANADPAQIEQVLMNLALNAADAMPQGGTLSIETCNVILNDSHCRENPELQAGEYVLLSITDTGSGMDRKTLEHIFEPFFTTKEVGRGTGLGLSMVYGIVRNHGGHISCYSEPGRGTTFKIHLPVAQTELKASDEEQPPLEICGRSRDITLVDHAEDVRDPAE